MTFRQTAAQFFQNIADYLDPKTAWENKRQREIVAMYKRHAEGNFSGRELTLEEQYQLYVDSFRPGLKMFQDLHEKIKEEKAANPT